MIEPTNTNKTNASTISALPSLGCTLPPLDKPKDSSLVLAPKMNRPVRMPKSADAWNRLQRIEHIEIVPVDDLFTVNVYLHHSQNRIPTNNESTALLAPSGLSASPRTDTTPDFQVLHSSDDFEALRASLWTAVRQYHPVYCELCDGLTMLLLTKLSKSPLLAMTIHRSPVKRANQLHKLLHRTLAEMHAKKSQCVAACRGQGDLAILLHGFLFGEDDLPETSSA